MASAAAKRAAAAAAEKKAIKPNGKIGEYTEDHLLNAAKNVVEKKTSGSTLLDLEAEERIPKFTMSGTYNGGCACEEEVQKLMLLVS
jgi:hypothetical protein